MRKFLLPAAVLVSLAVAGAAAAQGNAAMMSVLRDSCGKDIQTLCPGVQPGGGRIAQCLKEHQDKVSATCKSAIAQAMANRQQGGGDTGTTH
ncbi:MAG TPA: cysteine rich repeat-containing protein [Caulobacteraceae bacterium]|nr:cysteine rich repeat-containing protein [Caulobacteraceae bacterium]